MVETTELLAVATTLWNLADVRVAFRPKNKSKEKVRNKQ
jgi:hypothetical protein